MMYSLFKYFAFKVDPERVHHLAVNSLSRLPSLFSLYGAIANDEKLYIQTNVGTMSFPLGIAAGLDKNGELINYFGRLGVGGLEVGTVTPLPQEGNSRPRLFRIVKEKSLRNSMGFNGDGAKAVYKNVKKSNSHLMKVGINFGKNKITPNDKALDDYLKLFNFFEGEGDYYVINVSSPNTPGLRELQDRSFLMELDKEIRNTNVTKPVYLKVSPDLNNSQIEDLVSMVNDSCFSGIIATNTTSMHDYGGGGVSGKLLSHKSRSVRNKVLNLMKDQKEKEVFGVGGVSSIVDLWDFWRNGGKFMQVYSSFIFQGPGMIRKISEDIHYSINYFGVENLEELIRLIYLEKVKAPPKLDYLY